jgi:hypothetical protein
MSAPVEPWRGGLNQLIYALTYARSLDDATAREFAHRMVEWRIFAAGPDTYHRALTEAVGARPLFGPTTLRSPHDEASVRDFCGLVRHHLEAARPWAPRPFVKLPSAQWPWRTAATTAVVGTGMHQLSGRLWQVFDFVHSGAGPAPVLVGRLRSVDVVALVVSTSSPAHRRTTSLKVLEGEPEAAVASFLELSGLPADLVAPPPDPPVTSDPPVTTAADQPDAESEWFRVFVSDRRLWRADTGLAFDTRDGATLRPGPPRAIFVLDNQANLYASLIETVGEFHHSSLLSGQPVAAAGEIVARRGTVVELTARCPTYPVGAAELAVAAAALTEQGLPLDEGTVRSD